MPAARQLALTILALVLSGWSVPARAAVRADFNGDGVLDSAALEPGSRPVINVTFSGFGRTQKLILRERPVSLAAADIDRDGRVDLVGVSRSRGLVFWRNHPGAVFARAPRRVNHRRVRQFVSTIRNRLHHDRSDGPTDDARDSSDDVRASGAVDTDTRVSEPAGTTSRLYLTQSTHPRSHSPRTSASRAPPA